jgi:hypothetical protein
MAESRADDLIRRQEDLAAERRNFESQWQEIAELTNPMRAEFTTTRIPGEKRTAKIFDGTAGLAAENLAAGLWGMITNSANAWFALRHPDPALNERHEVKLWLDEATRRLRDAFAANGQRFYARVVDLYSDLVSFGTGVFYVDEIAADGRLFFSCRHLAECFIAESDQEQVDTVFRRFQWTARQALQRWPDGLSQPILRAAEKEPERRFPFLHAVVPSGELGTSRKTGGGRKFASVYIDVEGRSVLGQGGYYEFPYQVPRWSSRSRAVYGDGPGMLALADVKMINAMSRTTIVAAQKAADPPLLAPDEAAVRGVRTSPGGIIYGGVGPDGRVLYHPLVTGANINLGLEMEEQRRNAIREAFHFSLMMMVARPNQTATEVLARQEEKLRLMGPHLGRIQSEFLDPLITRVFGLMVRAGRLPPAPRSLQERPGLRVEYVSPLARAQKASEGAAIVRALEALGPLAQAKPDILDNFDEDAYARELADAFGMPSRLLRDPREVLTRRAQRQQAQASMQIMNAAAPLAGAVKNIAQAGQSMQPASGPAA